MSGKFDKLLNQFKSKKWDDRKEAYDIFKKKIDNKLATVLINELSKNTNEDFNYWILKLILHLKKLNVKNRKLLFAIIKNYSTTKNYKLLSYFIPLLVSFNDELSIIYLVELFKAPKWGIRNEVSENLIKIGGSVAPYLIKAFQNSSNPDVQYWAMKVYGKVMGSKSLEKLGNAYKSNNYLIRYYSIIALGESETTKAIPILVKSLDDNSFIIRTRSAEILERIGEKILPFLEVFFNKGTSNMKISTIKLFARIKGENGINDIVEMTKYLPDRSFYLISALAELKTFNSMNLLIELLLDPSWEVRKYTFDQLIKFGPYTIRFLKKYISDNKYIDTELLVWFSKIFSYFPVEASSEIVFLLKMKHEDVLNTFLENIRIDRITKDIVYELSSYFHHEKWPVRKKVALFLRKCGKLVIPFLKDYYSESVNADEKYWTARTLLYLGETTDLNVEGENDILLDELAQEVSKINEEIIKNIEPVPEKIIDKKEVIIEKISSLENMYLKNLLMGIVTEEDVRKQMNQVLMMKDYISKNDFSILLDLYDYVLEPGIKENLLEIMKPIFSQDYLDIFIYLFTAEENELLKIKILGFMKYSRTKAVFELATSLCDSKNEEIRSLALYIYKSHMKLEEEAKQKEISNEKEKVVADSKNTSEVATTKKKFEKKTVVKIKTTPAYVKVIMLLLLLLIIAETFLLVNHKKYLSQFDKNHNLTELKLKTEKLMTEEKELHNAVKKKIVGLKKKDSLIVKLKEKEQELKKLIAKRNIQIKKIKSKMIAYNKTKKSDDQIKIPEKIIVDKVAPKIVQVKPKTVSKEDRIPIEKAVVKEVVKEVIKKDVKKVVKKNIKKNLLSEIKTFYGKYSDFYNSHKAEEIKKFYSINYDDGDIKGTKILTKIESEISILGKAKLNLLVENVKFDKGNVIVRYKAYLSGKLKTGLVLSREMTETLVQDTLINEKGQYFIICTKDLQ